MSAAASVGGPAEKKAHVSSGTVLLLGCGLVAPPLIHYLNEHGVNVIVASRTKSKTEKVIAGLKHVSAVEWDIDQKDALEALDALTQKADIVCSLLPYIHHAAAAKIAIKHKKHFTSTSYVSDAMNALGPEAEAAGVALLNEMGVDPGLDFMSAQKLIDEVHAKKGEIVGFYSICGGLPAPQHNTNPFGYKLSWSPRGVLMASRNPAVYLVNGAKVDAAGIDLYTPAVYRTETVAPLGKYEWYPNRDSLKYIELFGIPEVQTIIRGTYRNVGWCSTMRVISTCGLTSMDDDKTLAGTKYSTFMQRVLKLDANAPVKAATAAKLGLAVDSPTIAKFEWLGLFSDAVIPAKVTTALDAVCHLMEGKMQYADGEKDMILMKHIFEIRYSNAHRETVTSTLVDYGQQPSGFSSMARTVSLPVAVAMRAMLDGRLNLKGLVRPFRRDIYTLVLAEMETLGVKFTEERLGEQLWVRHEVKPGEERVALVPSAAADLIKSGYRITVERSPTRTIDDKEYEKVGCEMVETGSWPTAPSTAIILGLKELPEANTPLLHRHVFFAHAYKNQGGWKELLARFDKGRGMVWDLEFLNDEKGRRVAAFGRPAGVAGMAVGLLQWANQRLNKKTGALKSWKTTDAMVADVKAALAAAVPLSAKKELPTVLVLGALGRCGGGAVWFAEQCGIKSITKWDLAETKVGGPFDALLGVDVLVNAIYLSEPIPPFVTNAMLDDKSKNRALSVFVDVSCDTSNPHNPFPIYKTMTTLTEPVLRVRGDEKTVNAADAVDVIAIDHLPSLVPLDSSVSFGADLLPTLRTINEAYKTPVWQRAEQLFVSKVAASKQ